MEDGYEPMADWDFLSSLWELRTIVDRDKEHCSIVCSRLQKHITVEQTAAALKQAMGDTMSSVKSRTQSGSRTHGQWSELCCLILIMRGMSAQSCVPQ